MINNKKKEYVIDRKNDVDVIRYIPWFTYYNQSIERMMFKKKIKKYSSLLAFCLFLFLIVVI